MTAKELRIGNIINYKGNYSNYKGETELNEHLFSYLLEVDDEWDLVEPISLTKQKLLDFGFIFGIKLQDFAKGIFYFVELINYGINVYGQFSEKGIFYFNNKTEIQYIHQLQNLYFTLTCKEII